MGILQKTAKFLGIDKFGQGLASAGRVVTGGVSQDRTNQQAVGSMTQKLLYAARQEKDPIRRAKLLQVAKQNGIDTSGLTAENIDPGLKLTNKEILGSAANVALNVLTPGAFKGGKAAVVAKNAALGGGFGVAQGLEKNRSSGGVVGSAVAGVTTGAVIGSVGLLAKATKEFVGNKVPEWMMNKAVKPALQDLKKNVKFGSDTLGKELLDEGVKGGPKKLMEIAQKQIQSHEDSLQATLNNNSLKGEVINRSELAVFLKGLLSQKRKVPGAGGDIKNVERIFNDLPEQMTVPQANEIKRAIYQELRDPAYKLDAKLTTKSEALKNIASGLKTLIEDKAMNKGFNDVAQINRKLSIYGRLENSMVDQLARELRNNGFGLTDAILTAGGWPTTFLALLRHAGQGTMTRTAQMLHKVDKAGTGIVGRTVKSTIKRSTLNAP